MAYTFFVVERNHPQFIHADSDDPKRIQLTKGDPLHHSPSEDVGTDSPELATNEAEDITSGVWLASAGTSHVLVQSGDDIPAVDEPKPSAKTSIPKKLRAKAKSSSSKK